MFGVVVKIYNLLVLESFESYFKRWTIRASIRNAILRKRCILGTDYTSMSEFLMIDLNQSGVCAKA